MFLLDVGFIFPLESVVMQLQNDVCCPHWQTWCWSLTVAGDHKRYLWSKENLPERDLDIWIIIRALLWHAFLCLLAFDELYVLLLCIWDALPTMQMQLQVCMKILFLPLLAWFRSDGKNSLGWPLCQDSGMVF